MRTVIAQRGQTVFDIAMQEMGSIEGLFKIMAMNPGMRMDEAIATGTVVILPDKPLKSRIADFYKNKGIKPISGWVQNTVNINQDVAIAIDGTTYSDAIATPDLSNYLTIAITTHDALVTGSIIVAVYSSFDNKLWAPVGSEVTLGDETPINTPFAEGEFIKLRFREAIATTNSITNITLTYEKYF